MYQTPPCAFVRLDQSMYVWSARPPEFQTPLVNTMNEHATSGAVQIEVSNQTTDAADVEKGAASKKTVIEAR